MFVRCAFLRGLSPTERCPSPGDPGIRVADGPRVDHPRARDRGGRGRIGRAHDRHRWVVAPLLSRKEIILQEGGHEFSGIYISLNVKHPRHSFIKNGKRSMERFEGKKMASHLYHHSLRLPTLPPAPYTPPPHRPQVYHTGNECPLVSL